MPWFNYLCVYHHMTDNVVDQGGKISLSLDKATGFGYMSLSSLMYYLKRSYSRMSEVFDHDSALNFIRMGHTVLSIYHPLYI